MLIRRKKTKKTTSNTISSRDSNDPNIGSGWWAGKDGAGWMAPDSARPRFETIDGVTRPVRRY